MQVRHDTVGGRIRLSRLGIIWRRQSKKPSHPSSHSAGRYGDGLCLCLSAEYPRPSEDSVVAMSAFLSWVRDVESITISDELKAALTRRIQQILRPGEGGGGGGSGGIRMLSYEWLGIGDYGFGLQDNREVYYSPKVSVCIMEAPP